MGKKFRLISGTTEEDAIFEEIEEHTTTVSRSATIQEKLALIEMYQNEIARLTDEIEQMKKALTKTAPPA